MRKIIAYLLLMVVALGSCEKEIEIDYRDIKPLYVIYGEVSNEGCEVSITKTRDISDPEIPDGIEVQSVTISDASGIEYPLSYSSDGKYHSDSLVGIIGMTYTLKVTIDEISIESTSTMPGAIEIEKVSMHWEDLMGNDMLHLVADVRDVSTDVNYYYYRVLRNGKLYKWNVVKDLDNAAGTTQFDISLMSRKKAEENDPDDYDSIIYENDEITIEVRAIDLKTYDYLFSAKLSGQNSSNPINNFDKDFVLGYFSAFYNAERTFRFYYKDIAE